MNVKHVSALDVLFNVQMSIQTCMCHFLIKYVFSISFRIALNNITIYSGCLGFTCDITRPLSRTDWRCISWPIVCLHVFSSVLWCPLLFARKNGVRFVFALINYIRVSCFIYVSCIYLYILLFNTISISGDVRVV